MKKVIVFYPYETGERAFLGGVPKVVVSNIIACNTNGYTPYLLLPINNTGLISYVKENFSYCQISPINFKPIILFSDTKGLKRYWNIIKNACGFIKGRRKIRKTLKEINADIIHFHEVINFPLLNICNNAKVILHLHSFRFTSYNYILPIILYFVNKYTDVVVSPTKSIISALGSNLVAKSFIINTPYLELPVLEASAPSKMKMQNYKKEGRILFSFVGRICSIKRIDHFLHALHSLSENQREKIKFCIIGGINNVGDEEYLKSLQHLIQQYHVETVVDFLGYVNPIENVLPYIDYGVILSESEAIPMIGVEYMRFNIPILGYDAPGISDFLYNNINGFLLENGNVSDVVNCLNNIISNNSQIKQDFVSRIPAEFKKYSIDNFTSFLKEIY